MQHNYQDLICLFNQTFLSDYNTELCLGADEPLYLPANKDNHRHRIIFARQFYASALHEIAHWCIAGKKRRLLEDYGYWYQADGRDAKAQIMFEQVEVKPQAIEWIFAASCQFHFHVSCDNLSKIEPDRETFTQKVKEQVVIYLNQGMPKRAKIFSNVLRNFYHTPQLNIDDF